MYLIFRKLARGARKFYRALTSASARPVFELSVNSSNLRSASSTGKSLSLFRNLFRHLFGSRPFYPLTYPIVYPIV